MVLLCGIDIPEEVVSMIVACAEPRSQYLLAHTCSAINRIAAVYLFKTVSIYGAPLHQDPVIGRVLHYRDPIAFLGHLRRLVQRLEIFDGAATKGIIPKTITVDDSMGGRRAVIMDGHYLPSLKVLVYAPPSYIATWRGDAVESTIESVTYRHLQRWTLAAVNLEHLEIDVVLRKRHAIRVFSNTQGLCVLVIRNLGLFPGSCQQDKENKWGAPFEWPNLTRLVIANHDIALLKAVFSRTSLRKLTHLDVGKSSVLRFRVLRDFLELSHASLRVLYISSTNLQTRGFHEPPVFNLTLPRLEEVHVHFDARVGRRRRELDLVKAFLVCARHGSPDALRVLTLDFYVHTILVREYGQRGASGIKYADPTGAFGGFVKSADWVSFSDVAMYGGCRMRVHVSTWDETGNAVADDTHLTLPAQVQPVPWRKAVRDNIKACLRDAGIDPDVSFSCKRYIGVEKGKEPESTIRARLDAEGRISDEEIRRIVMQENVSLVYNWSGETMLG
ncbi:hypothetical protein BD626DRAFT_573658 [Schizophyllum amplum]|uniref:Uncharacterized protein n=1 Tax=Schizophyllum amplum TaxID=97359 RepID=A0A550C0X0_9AGAR|nr:hypothetical protein BD626DRAFT_573658 [Auriculariopsis ampla]